MNLPIKVLGIGHYVPSKIVTNHDMEKIVETSDEWITSRTGIKERRKVTFEKTHDMAFFASKEAIKKAKINVQEIDLIICATITENKKTPSVANLVGGMLGIENNLMSFDVNAACTGFIYALEIASSLIQEKKFRKALVIGAETITNILNYEDRNTCILFGDGAGAMVIEKGTNKNLGYFYNSSRPDMNQVLDIGDKIKMDGRKVFLFAVDIIEKSINQVLKQSKMKLEDFDNVIPHQANERIISAVAKSMQVDKDFFFTNLHKYGNTSAASIPIALSEYKASNPKSSRLILVGFGGGFTFGAAIIEV